MLKISDDVRFFADVKLNLQALKAEFKMEFRLLETDVLAALQARQRKGAEAMQPDLTDEARAALRQDAITPEQFCHEIVAGWPFGEVQGPDGNAMAFSADNLSRVLKLYGMPMAVVNAFYGGYDEATEGNSAPLPAGS